MSSVEKVKCNTAKQNNNTRSKENMSWNEKRIGLKGGFMNEGCCFTVVANDHVKQKGVWKINSCQS